MVKAIDAPTPWTTKRIVWVNLVFFAVTTLITVVGVPLYMLCYGISFVETALFLSYLTLTGLAITVGYHRLYAHSTFKASSLAQFFILFFGAAAFEQSALNWASQHRNHHQFADTERDPYNIKKGFFYAHIGWLIFWDHRIDHSNIKDLLKNKLATHQHRFYYAWSILAGILMPVAIGALAGRALGAIIFAVCARMTFVYHSTFCINSVCHKFGRETYDADSTAKDHWFVALITNGEGYHNFHHRFPGDYRNGIRWYHWDPSKWVIAFLEKVGMVWEVRKTSTFKILQAKLQAENKLLLNRLEPIRRYDYTLTILENLNARYASLMENLSAWEASAKEYKLEVIQRATDKSSELRRSGRQKMQQARTNFETHYRQWLGLIRSLEPALIPTR